MNEGRLFIGTMHGAALTGASHVEPDPGMGIAMATITNCLLLSKQFQRSDKQPAPAAPFHSTSVGFRMFLDSW
jgi:hypothetical protein